MRHFLLISILFLLGVSAFGQVPGYMGKKHLFTYTPSISLFSNNYRINRDKGYTKFFLSHNASYNYVIKTRKTIGLFYEYTGMETFVESVYNGNGANGDIVYANFRKHQIGFAYRKYVGRNTLAPLGTYFKFSISAIFAKSEITPETLPNYLDYYADFSSGNIEWVTEASNFDIATGVGLGRQFIIAKYIPLNIEMDINIPWGTFFTPANADIERSHKANTAGSTLFKVNLGIGILAF